MMRLGKPFTKHMTLTKNSIVLAFVALWGLSSCDYLQVRDADPAVEPEVNPIARAHDAYLYPSDVEGIVKPNTSQADSAAIMERYVNAWIKKQLMLNEAASRIDFDEAELERKILDYRYALMVYQYEKYYVQQMLDMNVSQTEIEEYYEAHRESFQLKQNIIHGKFVKLSKEAPQQSRFRRLLQSDAAADQEEIKSYCFRFAENYLLDDTTWVNFDEVVKGSPWNSMEDRADFLQKNKFVEVEGDEHIYFLKIDEYKLVGEISPLEFVTDQIEQIILNRRKVDLTDKLEEDVYERAFDNENFEIFRDE